MDLDSWETDRGTVQAPQRLGLKRLTQLIDVLKDDEKDRQASGQPNGWRGAGRWRRRGKRWHPAAGPVQVAAGPASRESTSGRTRSRKRILTCRSCRSRNGPSWTRSERPRPTWRPCSKKSPRRNHQPARNPDKFAGSRTSALIVFRPLIRGLTPLAIHGGPYGANSEGTGQDPQRPSRRIDWRRNRAPRNRPRPDRRRNPRTRRKSRKTPPSDEAEKLREKIAQEMQSAEKKLKDRDPGPDTRQAAGQRAPQH